jgi:hypothetical protein
LEQRETRCRALIEEFGRTIKKHPDGWEVTSPSGKQRVIRSLRELESYARRLEINYQQTD